MATVLHPGGEVGGGQLDRPRQTNDLCHILGPGAHVTLVVTTVELLVEPDPAAHIEKPASLGSVELVARAGEKIDPERRHIDRNLADCLDGVGVEEEVALTGFTTLPDQVCHLGNRLYRADFVVGVHDRNEHRLGSQGLAQILDAHYTVGVDGKVGDPPAA